METVTAKCAGLWLQGNDTQAPDGALTVADNAVITEDDLIETRRGLQVFNNTTAFEIVEFFGASGRGLYLTSAALYYFDGATFASLGAYSRPNEITLIGGPTGTLLPHAVTDSGSLCYFSADKDLAPGFVWRTNNSGAAVVSAGAPPGLDAVIALSVAAGTAVPTNSQVAYRVVWVQKAGNRRVAGPPSWRFVIANTSGSTKNVDLTITVPQGLGITATTHYLQVYRTRASASSIITPDDEMGLVLEQAAPGSGQTVSVTDTVTDALMGAALYTNPSQEGILQANWWPPQAGDMALFRACVFYAPCYTRPSFDLVIFGTGAGALNVGSTVSLAGGQTYTGAAAENIAAHQFQVFTGGTTSQNIANTAASLIRVVNRDPSAATNRAFAVSTDSDSGAPGNMRFISRSGEDLYHVGSLPAGTRSPTNGASAGGLQDDAIYFSKVDQPEAVPLVNRLPLKGVMRIMATRDSLFIFSPAGIHRITGSGPADFRLDPFDQNARLVAPRSLVQLDNKLFGLFDAGVCAVTDTGLELVSRAIEPVLRAFAVGGVTPGTLRYPTAYYAFGTASETDHKYILWLPAASSDTECKQAYVLDLLSFARTGSGWTRWPFAAVHGKVDTFDARLYLVTSEWYLRQERKDFAQSDYADDVLTVTISSAPDSFTLVISGTPTVAVGDIVIQGAQSGIVTAVTVAGNTTVSLDRAGVWSPGAAFLYSAIDLVVEWSPKFAPPGKMHRFSEASLAFKRTYFAQADLRFATDLEPTLDGPTLTPGWGDSEQDHPTVRALIPRNRAWGSFLRVRFHSRQAWSAARLQALSVTYEPGTLPAVRTRVAAT